MVLLGMSYVGVNETLVVTVLTAPPVPLGPPGPVALSVQVDPLEQVGRRLCGSSLVGCRHPLFQVPLRPSTPFLVLVSWVPSGFLRRA